MSIPTPPNDPYARPAQSPGPGPYGQQPAPEPAQGAWGQSPVQEPAQDAWGQPPVQEPAQGAWGQPSASDPAQGAGAPFGQPPAAAGPAAGGPVSGPAPGTDLGADLGGALQFAGNTLLRNPVAFLVAGLIYTVVVFLLIAGGMGVGLAVMIPQLDAATTSEAAELGALLSFYAAAFVAGLLTIPFSLLWQSGSARAGVVVLEGGRPRLGQAMVGPMRIILTALLVMAITTVGFILLYIPGLIATVMLMFAIPAAARGASPVAAVKESFTLAKNNLGTTILACLVLAVIGGVVGAFLITFIALIPFAVLFQVGMYERLSGRELPEPARG
ncbi:hypothetical protein [Brachybacterium sp. FME24]|uniref:hypothetical protein n=1 Tax=Brachybacterium sp. FME24 TaxID=2742605 RepID=UPI001D00A7FD|nr:hypothetical protein [Brachybacterium sp. FME24]